MLENLLELPGTTEESSFFEEECMAERFTLLPHQRAQASVSTGAGGFRVSSAEARRMSASVGSLVATLSAVLADLSVSLGEKVRKEPAKFRSGDQYLGSSAMPPRLWWGHQGGDGRSNSAEMEGQGISP